MSDAGVNVTTDAAAEARKQQQAEDLKRAKDAGWNDPTPFKYEATANGETVEPDNRDSAAWLSDAAIYQWDDDFGEVGEPNPELEKQLFADENIQRRGGSLNALTFEVSLEGPLKVQPVREVRTRVAPIMLHCLTRCSSTMPAFTPSCV